MDANDKVEMNPHVEKSNVGILQGEKTGTKDSLSGEVQLASNLTITSGDKVHARSKVKDAAVSSIQWFCMPKWACALTIGIIIVVLTTGLAVSLAVLLPGPSSTEATQCPEVPSIPEGSLVGQHNVTTAHPDMTNMTTISPDVTTAEPAHPIPMYWGFIAAGVAVLFFGSNFVPVKKFETGDGLFFQWIFCAGIWFCGLIVNCITGFKQFYPLALLGGFLFAVGNTMIVPIIKTIGLGQGTLIWASFTLFLGWASGRFGFFGLKPKVPNKITFNYIGICLCFISAVIYFFIKEDTVPLLPKVHAQSTNKGGSSGSVTEPPPMSFIERLSPTYRRILGRCLAVITGLLSGGHFIPIIYIQDNYPGASQNGLDYVFATFCGIFGTSTIIFVCYCAITRNEPKVFPRVILPGFISGMMWAIADAAWFVANSALSEPVSFPIITTGPGIVAALWGILLFKEVSGKKNIVLLLVATVFAITGSVLTGYSKS